LSTVVMLRMPPRCASLPPRALRCCTCLLPVAAHHFRRQLGPDAPPLLAHGVHVLSSIAAHCTHWRTLARAAAVQHARYLLQLALDSHALHDPHPLLLPSGGAHIAPFAAARRRFRQLQLASGARRQATVLSDQGRTDAFMHSTPLDVPNGFWGTGAAADAFAAAFDVCKRCAACRLERAHFTSRGTPLAAWRAPGGTLARAHAACATASTTSQQATKLRCVKHLWQLKSRAATLVRVQDPGGARARADRRRCRARHAVRHRAHRL
jgi:hypothetical protein